MLPFKKILFPVDFSEHACGAARYAEAFAGRFEFYESFDTGHKTYSVENMEFPP